MMALGFVMVVNLSVSHFGQTNAFLLSPFHLYDKTRALFFLAFHQINRLGAQEMPNPRKALLDSARKHKIPKNLALAIAKAESDFIPSRISPTGAMGLMQLMPDTAKDMGVRDPFHTGENAEGGVKYLSTLWKRYNGDRRRIVAAYNTGLGRVPRAGSYTVSAETRHYVKKVLYYSRQF